MFIKHSLGCVTRHKIVYSSFNMTFPSTLKLGIAEKKEWKLVEINIWKFNFLKPSNGSEV